MTVAHTPLRRHPHGHRLLWLGAGVVLGAVVVALLVRRDDGGSSSVVEGSGVLATQTRELPAFAGVELGGDMVATVTVGGAQRVVVRADDNLVGGVTTTVESGRLVIRTPASFTADAPMSAEVTVPTLDALELSGTGAIAAHGIDGKTLKVALSGTGQLRATGSVERLDVTLGGTGDAALDGLVAADVHAVMSGSGRILVHATRSLDASVPGTGAIVYTGDPARVTRHVTGTGTVVGG
jgi:hypothetical protein